MNISFKHPPFSWGNVRFHLPWIKMTVYMILSHQVQMVILLSKSSFDISIIAIHVVIPKTFRLLKCSRHLNRDLTLDQVRLEQSFSPSTTCVATWLWGWRVLTLFKHPVTCGSAMGAGLQHRPSSSGNSGRMRVLPCGPGPDTRPEDTKGKDVWDVTLYWKQRRAVVTPLIWVFKENIFWG